MSSILTTPIEYDCYRAAGYRYFGIAPRYGNSRFLITSLLYEQEPERNLSSLKGIPDLKTREFKWEGLGMREVVLLFCNSDVIIRSKRYDDVFSLFLLPKNGYVELQEGETKPSWTEENASLLRILFYKSASLSLLPEVIDEVTRKKYAILSCTCLLKSVYCGHSWQLHSYCHSARIVTIVLPEGKLMRKSNYLTKKHANTNGMWKTLK